MKTSYTPQHSTELNNIDNTITIAKIFAEKKLSKLQHHSPWFTELRNRIVHASYWRLIKSQFKTKIDHS